MSIAQLLVIIAVVCLVLALLSLMGVVLEGAAIALLVVGVLCGIVGMALR